MKITTLGACGGVTGSCYLLETNQARILIDCGLFQGSKKIELGNKIPSIILKKPLDAVVLTHAHLDHSGRLLMLVKARYNGPIYATSGTCDIAHLILEDAARIHEQDLERENRRRRRAGLPPLKPLYEHNAVLRVNELMRKVELNEPREIAPGITVRLVEAGHILGSSSVVLEVKEDGQQKIVTFSGDLGPYDAPILNDPTPELIGKTDILFMESTYGDRDHRPLDETVLEFEQLISEAISGKGKILIPTFAIGRCQQLLYHLAALTRTGRLNSTPIYLDSPMAISATAIYNKHRELMDQEALALTETGQMEKDLSHLRLIRTAEESMALNSLEGPMIIMAGAGMCNAGRILHHLRHNLYDPHTTVMIVGWQAHGSLGRKLLEGEKKVKICGETVVNRAKVASLGGFSAHAGQSDLLRWLHPLAQNKDLNLVLTHGEELPRQALARQVGKRYGIEATIPRLGETLEFV
jgi:metallo-beta-lactamase family protein